MRIDGPCSVYLAMRRLSRSERDSLQIIKVNKIRLPTALALKVNISLQKERVSNTSSACDRVICYISPIAFLARETGANKYYLYCQIMQRGLPLEHLMNHKYNLELRFLVQYT